MYLNCKIINKYFLQFLNNILKLLERMNQNNINVLDFNKRCYFVIGDIGFMLFFEGDIELCFYDSSKSNKNMILHNLKLSHENFLLYCQNNIFFDCNNIYYQNIFIEFQKMAKQYYNNKFKKN